MNEQRLYDIIVRPHVSEKSTRVADKHRQFIFAVKRDADKPAIRQAVEKMFNVKVEAVTVANVKGKIKRTKTPGRRQDWKKAYVTLKPGHDINFVGSEAK